MKSKSTETLLVTGGCGFIGSNFIRHFLLKYPTWSVINLDALTYAGNPENLKDVESQGRYQFIEGNITDKKIVSTLMSQVQTVMHFAAETHVDRSIENPDIFLSTNILGTHTLLEAARQNKIGRFIHMSTDEVYGSVQEGSADENYPLAPNSPYAASKAAGDLLIRSYWKTYRFPAVIVRCSNNYGPYQFPEKIIPFILPSQPHDIGTPVSSFHQAGRGCAHQKSLDV